MQRFHLLTGCAIALALAVLLGACDDGPTRPTRLDGPQNVPVTVTRLEVAGPGDVSPGESAQYSAIAHQSDGSTRDVTNGAAWRTGHPSVLTISSTGLATGRERGETFISVSASGRTAVRNDVIVVAAGTYRLAGTVRDAGVAVLGARVEVTAGPAQGLGVTADGAYRLYGVSGDTEVRVTKDGYQEQTKSLQVTNHQTLDFDLILSRPRDEVSGTYTLTVAAAAECRAALPEEARIRTYTAVLTQDGPRLTVVLEGSKFLVAGGRTLNSFGGTVEPNRVSFKLSEFYSDYYNDLPDVLEELTATTFLGVSGSAATTVSPTGLSGTLNGPIETLQGVGSGRFDRASSCRSTGHQFVLSR